MSAAEVGRLRAPRAGNWVRFVKWDGGCRPGAIQRGDALDCARLPARHWFNPYWPAQATTSGGCHTAPFFQFHVASRYICCIGVSECANRFRLRLKLSKNEGVPDRTPCGECGEPFRAVRISLCPDIRVARGFRGIGGWTPLGDCFQSILGDVVA